MSVRSFDYLSLFLYSNCLSVRLFDYFSSTPVLTGFLFQQKSEKMERKKEKEKNSHHLENITGIGQKSKFFAFKDTIEP